VRTKSATPTRARPIAFSANSLPSRNGGLVMIQSVTGALVAVGKEKIAQCSPKP
jgi:hypothetical protein